MNVATATKVRTLRLEAGLTQEALARLVGMSTSAIQKIEAGRTTPGGGNARRLAEVLGCKTDDLFDEDTAAATG